MIKRLATKKLQRADDAMAREAWARLLRRGHSASNLARSAERFFLRLDELGTEATFAEFLIAYERECEIAIGPDYLLN
jgi:hypothetical protein